MTFIISSSNVIEDLREALERDSGIPDDFIPVGGVDFKEEVVRTELPRVSRETRRFTVPINLNILSWIEL